MTHSELTHQEALLLICDALGEDVEAPVCKELEEHFSRCPNCRIYFSTLKQVVNLCRQVEADREIPADVEERLLQSLASRPGPGPTT